MSQTIIEKIFSTHSGQDVKPGDIVDLVIDVRVARDFGGANVVQNIRENGLAIHDPRKTFFTFDCYPGGTDAKYATNQQVCRVFAQEHDITVYDMNVGIGTHVVIDQGLVGPGMTFVSTDSHANILGAIGAFGQGMGDQDIAAAWANGKTWFKTPPSVKVILKGTPSPLATAKDLTLAVTKHFGANGLLGYAAEFYGDYVDTLDLEARITLASMCTEMGGLIILFPPNETILDALFARTGKRYDSLAADEGASYEKVIEIDVEGLKPQIARPGHPEDVVDVASIEGKRVDSVFIGSCTNGRYADIKAAADIVNGKKLAPNVVMKIVPATDQEWKRLLDEGILKILNDAGALISNPGCGGCAAGQVGQNGPGEVTVSTGNRNFAGKQGKGEVWLASPETAAASAIAGVITTKDRIDDAKRPELSGSRKLVEKQTAAPRATAEVGSKTEFPTTIRGRVWLIDHDNIDTDMIFHNRYLNITEIAQMGQYTFDNLKGWEDFSKRAKAGDIVITGKNFGAGSSRQQAVDCFLSLGISLIVAESFGSIYERNAINAGMPIMNGNLLHEDLRDGDEIEVNFITGDVINLASARRLSIQPFAKVQLEIYQRGGLLRETVRF